MTREHHLQIENVPSQWQILLGKGTLSGSSKRLLQGSSKGRYGPGNKNRKWFADRLGLLVIWWVWKRPSEIYGRVGGRGYVINFHTVKPYNYPYTQVSQIWSDQISWVIGRYFSQVQGNPKISLPMADTSGKSPSWQWDFILRFQSAISRNLGTLKCRY